MKPPVAAGKVTPLREVGDDAWGKRSGRLFVEFERPAKAMVRRAFRGAFCSDELDDIYANAWVGTLRALAGRHGELADDEIRSYVLTAVANQASKELRRRRRKPTAPLELVGSVPDLADTPEERAASREQSLLTRDLLASMPPRRRAVMLLRYGWGLEPAQVCGLVAGLSPRAYRKEVTRGVDELTEKMRAVERGTWCADREPLLKALAAGLAGDDEARQARAHLSHCRSCSDFVARLSGHLHDIGGGAAAVSAIDGLDGHIAITDRLMDLGDRTIGLVARGHDAGVDGTVSPAAAAGSRGAGAAGAGVLAKLAGVGAAGKVALACVGGGVAATACIAAGVGPFEGGTGDTPSHESAAGPPAAADTGTPSTPGEIEPVAPQIGNQFAPTPAAPADNESAGEDREAGGPAPQPAPAPAPEAPAVAPIAPPATQEFSAEAAAVAPTTSGSGSSGSASTEASAVHQEFGP